VLHKRRRVLHLFSGRVNTAEFPGDTCDVNAALEPTFIADAHDLTGVPIENYDLMVADPPYSAEDAAHYGTPLVNRNKVVDRTGCSLARTSHGSIRRSRCTPRHG